MEIKMTTIPIQIRIEKETFENIKKIAREESFIKNKDIKWQDLLRDIIYIKFKVSEDNKYGS